MRTRIAPAVIAAFLTLAATLPAQALDVWTQPNPGLLHLHRSAPGPAEFHVLIADLSQPGVRIRITPRAERWQTTSDYALEGKLAGAINAGPWTMFSQRALGLAASRGEIWSPDTQRLGYFAVGKDGVASIAGPREPRPNRQNIAEGVAGFALLVDAGKVVPKIMQLKQGRDARSAVGVSRDGRKVILVTVDGRRAGSAGASLDELAQLFVEFGAERAINLDGGNSTTMFIANEGGTVNHPARGWEREVVTHIGVQAPAPNAPAAAARVAETPKPAQAMAARPIPQTERGTRGRMSAIWIQDRVFIGQLREWILPGVTAGVPLALVLLLAWLWRRHARRRRAVSQSGRQP